jgi:hypothetical protein
MSGTQDERAQLGQENGPDVELVVSGTKQYATYESVDGFPVIYDERLGLFCYARVVDGRYRSTGVSLQEPPPPGVARHARESEDVRATRIREQEAQRERRPQPGRN